VAVGDDRHERRPLARLEHRPGLVKVRAPRTANFESASNVYLGPARRGGDVLELAVNVGRDGPYVLGDGHNHTALVVDDLDGLLRQLAAAGIEPERPPYMPGGRKEYRICFVADPDGYRVELLDTALPTP